MTRRTYESNESTNLKAPDGWPELDPAALHGPAGDIVNAIAPNTEADPVALLFDLLINFGVCVNSGPHVTVGRAIHHARDNVVLVGATSRGRKGQARAEIRPIFAGADPVFSDTRIVGGLTSGQGLVYAVRDAEGDDKGVSDKRLLAIEEEFSSVLKLADQPGNILSETIRRAWDTGNMRTMPRRDALHATGAHVGIIGHITYAELMSRLTEIEIANGFGNRFVFPVVRQQRLLPHGGRVAGIDSQIRLIRTALEKARTGPSSNARPPRTSCGRRSTRRSRPATTTASSVRSPHVPPPTCCGSR